MLSALLGLYLRALHGVLGWVEAWTRSRAAQHLPSSGTSPDPAKRLAVVFVDTDAALVSDRIAADILRW